MGNQLRCASPPYYYVAIVSYDYDYGWICEEWRDGNDEYEGEYEFSERTTTRHGGHTEAARKDALKDGIEIARKRDGKVKHFYEYPDSVARKRREYKGSRRRALAGV